MTFARLLAATVRREHGKILAVLIRESDNFDLSEEALADTYLKAQQLWPSSSVPAQPGAWLLTVARHRLRDLRRRNQRIAPNSSDILAELAAPEITDGDDPNACFGGDDTLRLIFTCCHPALPKSASMALALRTLCGLTTREIARAFVEPEATTAQKIVRAKRKISEAKIPYLVPAAAELPDRLASVLATLYLLFNEGFSATAAAALQRQELALEAIRLSRLLFKLLPDQAECAGLLALMLLHQARAAARVDAAGVLIALEEQDRARWDRALIREGLALLDGAVLKRQAGPYQIQAAIAALHAQAAVPAQTDWAQIALLYSALLRHTPTPVVELNAAVALAMSAGPAHGLAWIEQISAGGELNDYHLLHAARADLLRRSGQPAAAAVAYAQALAHVSNQSERAYLERRLAEVCSPNQG